MALPCSSSQPISCLHVLFSSTLDVRATNCTNRGSATDLESCPRLACLDVITTYGTRVAAATRRHGQFLAPAHNLATLRRQRHRHGYLSIQLSQTSIGEHLRGQTVDKQIRCTATSNTTRASHPAHFGHPNGPAHEAAKQCLWAHYCPTQVAL